MGKPASLPGNAGGIAAPGVKHAGWAEAMCGIAGYLSSSALQGSTSTLISMTRALRHRGPDDEGFVLISTADDRHQDFSGAESDGRVRERYPRIEDQGVCPSHDIAMGHRRFSIIDLSPDGHQPMWDDGHSACVSFYGEIYNYIELRKELEEAGAVFRTRSDTEVILLAYRHWGSKAFAKFNGPFAIALYDRRTRRMLLARDRIGKASFYYTIRGGRLYWATEIKSFLQALGIGREAINREAVDDFVLNGQRDLNGTFWNGVHDFPPASFAYVRPDLSLDIESYWQLPQPRLTLRQIDIRDAIDEFRSILVDSIRVRQRADVPVAFELSGGMDSSAIVGLSATHLQAPITTYTVKNREAHSDESSFAKAVADVFPDQVDSRMLVPPADDFWDAADEFVWVEEEPFHSPNLQTNQRLRRQMRSEGHKVVIAGSAGDELLAGYSGDYLVPFLRRLLRKGAYGEFARELGANSEIPISRLLLLFVADAVLPSSARAWRKAKLFRDYYEIGPNCGASSGNDRAGRSRLSFDEIMIENMGRRKMNYWLRAGPKAMFGIPIEPRSPFLDYRLVDFAFTLPPELLIKDGWLKWILREAVSDILPETIVRRRQKMGFPFPLREWLASSKDNIAMNMADTDCPYLKSDRILESYGQLTARAPEALWRLTSLMLWWRRVIEGKSILRAA